MRRIPSVLGPVFPVEMVASARRRRYFVTRAGYATSLLFVVWICFDFVFRGSEQTSLIQSAMFSEMFFTQFAFLQLFVALVTTCVITAGTIAEERQRRTIEYLFATDLSNRELIIGKLAAKLANVLALLAVAVPILFATMFFGGVSVNSILQAFAITLSSVVLSACISVWVSVWTARPRDAVVRAFALLGAFMVLPFVLVYLRFAFPRLVFLDLILPHVFSMNPFCILMEQIYGTPPFRAFRTYIGWTGIGYLAVWHLMICLCAVGLAVWRVRVVHLKDKRQPRVPEVRKLFRPSIGQFPMLWKEVFAEKTFRDLRMPGKVFLVLIVLAILSPIVTAVVRSQQRGIPFEYCTFAASYSASIGGIFLLIVAARSATSVSIERESQTWDLLLSTQLSATDIILGKMLGSMYAFRCILWILLLIWGVGTFYELQAITGGLAVTAGLLVMAPFYSGAGVLLSLVSKNSSRAMIYSLLVSVFFLGGYLLLFIILISDRMPEDVLVLSSIAILIALGISINPYTEHLPAWIMYGGMAFYIISGLGVNLAAILLFDQFTQRAGLRTQDAEEISRQSPAEAVRIVEPTTVAERG